MTDAADLNEEDKPIWNGPHWPAPWNAVIDEEASEAKADGVIHYRVICDGYNDETPTVCVGDPAWPLTKADAHILAASLDLLAVAKVMLDFTQPGNNFSYPLGSIQMLQEAVAKAEGRR